MTTKFDHLAKPDAEEWAGLRLPARTRLAAVCDHLIKTGTLQRADIVTIGEVSVPQASLDIRAILERAPELMTYDASGRCYRFAGATEGAAYG
jgi:hypothetical protein